MNQTNLLAQTTVDEALERLTEMIKEDPWAGDVTVSEVQDEMDYELRREKDYDLAQERLTEMIKEDPWAGDVTVGEVLDEMDYERSALLSTR